MINPFQEHAYSLFGIFGSRLPIIFGGGHSVLQRHLRDIGAGCGHIQVTALDRVGKHQGTRIRYGSATPCSTIDPADESSKFHNCLPWGDITSHKAPPSIFQKSVDRHVLKCMPRAEHYRARYQLNCRRNLQRRHHNTRHHNTRHHTRYSQPAHNTEACQITLYITAEITHHGVRSPCVHPLADARSV
ncbi:hypothetical protein P692DRAFT_201039006 [Suillus brevipes Sb2]|nr:hypothetical protein P692DRAFT_201039006 [Suillus brevipes Sb2]